MTYLLYLSASFLRTWLLSSTVFKPSKCIRCQGTLSKWAVGWRVFPPSHVAFWLLQRAVKHSTALDPRHKPLQSAGLSPPLTDEETQAQGGHATSCQGPTGRKGWTKGQTGAFTSVHCASSHLTPLCCKTGAGFSDLSSRRAHNEATLSGEGRDLGQSWVNTSVLPTDRWEVPCFQYILSYVGSPPTLCFSLLLRGKKKTKAISETLGFVEENIWKVFWQRVERNRKAASSVFVGGRLGRNRFHFYSLAVSKFSELGTHW